MEPPVVEAVRLDDLPPADPEQNDDDWGEDFGLFDVPVVKPASRRAAQAARRASGGAVRPKSGGTRHEPIVQPLPLAWKEQPDGKYQKYKQPSNLLAKGWRLWPDDKIEKDGMPQSNRPAAPDLFDSRHLGKNPDEKLSATGPADRLDKVELAAKVCDRRMQRAVVLHTLGYFKSETIERPNSERMAAVNANLASVFGEGVKWNAKEVITWAAPELNLVGNELLYYEPKLSSFQRTNEVRCTIFERGTLEPRLPLLLTWRV